MSDTDENRRQQLQTLADKALLTLYVSDDRLREALRTDVIEPYLQLHNAGGTTAVGDSGYCTALNSVQLAQKLSELGLPPDDFPIPADCGYWHRTEPDPRDGTMMRFFFKHAWLDLPLPDTDGTLALTIPFAIGAEALRRFEMRIGTVPLALDTSGRDGHDRIIVRTAVSGKDIAANRTDLGVRLHFTCPVFIIPREITAGAQDPRRLSLAVTYPVFTPANAKPFL